LEKERLDIAALQVYCLIILARQVFSADTAWVSAGSLVHGAMQMGLHRDPKHLPAMPVLQAELRRRLWATVLELAVQSSLVAWMPPRILLDEFDTEPPSNINDDEMDESTTALQPHPKATFTSTSIQLAMFESLPIRLRIAQYLNGLQPERAYNQALALNAELTSALQAHTTLFATDSGTAAAFHRNLVDYLTRRFLIPLHFPFILQARNNQLCHLSYKISLDAALALLSPLISPDEQDPDGSFSRLMLIGGALFRDGIRGATAVIGLALISRRSSPPFKSVWSCRPPPWPSRSTPLSRCRGPDPRRLPAPHLHPPRVPQAGRAGHAGAGRRADPGAGRRGQRQEPHVPEYGAGAGGGHGGERYGRGGGDGRREGGEGQLGDL
jgi:hypothetical protein